MKKWLIALGGLTLSLAVAVGCASPVPTPTLTAPPTPTLTAPPTPTPTLTATPTPTLTATPTPFVFSDGELGYGLVLPGAWQEGQNAGGDTTFTAHGGIVTVRVSPVNRTRYANAFDYASRSIPSQVATWTEYETGSLSVIGDATGAEVQVTGLLGDVPHVLIVQWFFRGARLVEITSDFPSSVWDRNAELVAEVRSIFLSLDLNAVGRLLTPPQVTGLVIADLRTVVDSGLFIRDEQAGGLVPISCIDGLEELMNEPLYVGDGDWSITTRLEPLGFHAWIVLEPSGEIIRSPGNASHC